MEMIHIFPEMLWPCWCVIIAIICWQILTVLKEELGTLAETEKARDDYELQGGGLDARSGSGKDRQVRYPLKSIDHNGETYVIGNFTPCCGYLYGLTAAQETGYIYSTPMTSRNRQLHKYTEPGKIQRVIDGLMHVGTTAPNKLSILTTGNSMSMRL